MKKMSNHVSRNVILKTQRITLLEGELQHVKGGDIHYYSNSIPTEATTRRDPNGANPQATIGPRVS
jgi:hypothetical protein